MSDLAPDPAPPARPLDPTQQAALAWAKRWNLVCDNGQVICLRQGCGLEATLPTLLCAGHLASHRRMAR